MARKRLTAKEVLQKHGVVKQTRYIKEPQPVRIQILEKGAALTSGDRDKTYGNPVNNMQHFADMLTAYFNTHICQKNAPTARYHFTAEDAAVIMVLAKASRLKANPGVPFHLDNYIDAATYMAMAGECGEKGQR